MEKKQVIIISLLIVAIVLSTVSIALNITFEKMINPYVVLDTQPQGNLKLEILENPENIGVNTNEPR
jgi:hypothetical protein